MARNAVSFSLSAVLCLMLAFSACKLPRGSSEQMSLGTEATSSDGGVNSSTFASGDFLEVRVYQEPDLSGAFRVSSDGFLEFPLCGRVKVAGMTANMAAQALTACLANGFLRRPQVVVLVKEFNSKKIFVFGDVSKPGSYAFEDGMTIVQALSTAGGFNKTASKNGVNIVRVVDGHEIKLPVKVEDIIMGRERNFSLLPGDIVFVPEGFF